VFERREVPEAQVRKSTSSLTGNSWDDDLLHTANEVFVELDRREAED
jgi:hypothetical protein